MAMENSISMTMNNIADPNPNTVSKSEIVEDERKSKRNMRHTETHVRFIESLIRYGNRFMFSINAKVLATESS